MTIDTEEIEIRVLVEAIRLKYGYDFTQYAQASLARRIRKVLAGTGLGKISEMIAPILYDRAFFDSFVFDLSVNVTEMFRDPFFFVALRENVAPYLKTFPHIKVWSAGVASGEEAYSLMILLREEGLAEKALMYATDFNDAILEIAMRGIYSREQMKKSTLNYQQSGGKGSFGDYYHADYDSAIVDRSLKRNMVFANHNLVTDEVFGEMHMILCRNVLIYFNKDLQNRVLRLFHDSLRPHGFLCLGGKETIDFSDIAHAFVPVAEKQRIYQKKGSA